jgi:prevent-host-death family protein
MTVIASRDLRNHTAAVLQQVADGERVTVTVHGRPVAEIGPVSSSRPRFFSRTELFAVLDRAQADPGLRRDLATLAGDTTDDLADL